MRAQSPPTPDDERWVTAYASTNGAGSSARAGSANRLLALAYILAFAMPPIGFGLGIAIAVRFSNPRSRHGVAIIAISIVAAIIWILIITSGVLNATGTANDY